MTKEYTEIPSKMKSLLERIVQQEAVAFAEWIAEVGFVSGQQPDDLEWFYPNGEGIGNTANLFTLYLNSKKL